jgi:FHS family L-fucose permease-like MFS transporter
VASETGKTVNPEGQGLFRAEDGKSLAFTFALVSSLFLLWGLCNGMIDVMDKHFQTELGLSKAESAWVQFAHYLGYFLMAMPAGWLATRLGYKGGIIAGLVMVAAGGFWFVPATHINELAHLGRVSSTTAFVGYLVGVCVIAAGLTFLETVANPYATVLGPPRYAATRINLAQSCNGIGWLFGPILGGMFFYSKNAAGESTGSATLFIPYLAVAIVVLLLVVVFAFAPVPDIRSQDDYQIDGASAEASHSMWKQPHFVMAVVAQFCYVAAQAGIFSFFINYITSEVPPLPAAWSTGAWQSLLETRQGVLAVSDRGAATLASVGFLFFLAGRFSGAALLKRYSAHKLLGLYGLLNVVACFLVFLKLGWLSVACVFGSYFFMSIMFPTIFALGIFGLGARAKMASSFIVMAIMGGALLPKLMGAVADRYDMSRGFIVPLACFAVVAAYGYAWPRLSKARSLDGLRPGGGH